MNSSQIETNVQNVIKNFSKEEFLFDLLLAYGLPKATITLLKKGRHNLSKKEGQIILKKKVFFEKAKGKNLHEEIEALMKDPATMRHDPRFVMVTDSKTLLAVDTKTKERLDVAIQELPKHFAFFLPWAGIEKYQHKNENPADRKAAEKMAKLYDDILADNHIEDDEKRHALNVFLARLLFCFFAEDTRIFQKNIFTESIASHTQETGSDLREYLDRLFEILNTPEDKRENLPAHLEKFPYVNGGLFAKKLWIPRFSAKARRAIIECGDLDWKEINPDIFGSMIQAVVHPGERGSLGMHYTSVPNIMKVIEPLFLNDLRAEFESICQEGNLFEKSSPATRNKKLDQLRMRMSQIKFFDPACGSGNFLIITYKELRKLEMKIIEEQGQFSFTDIHLNQFYGIEIDDFAAETTKLSLYLAEHQMNVQFQEKFGNVQPTLPLQESGNIVCGNATRLNWEEVCPRTKEEEVYVFGNPPYLGSRNQDDEQKGDMKFVFKKDYKSLDYISCWFSLGAKYIRETKAQLAFVSTNSICQGEQVALLWPRVLHGDLEIGFAHTSFKWINNAKGNAGVTVIIVGLRNISKEQKYLFVDGMAQSVKNINPYLTGGNTVYIQRRPRPISDIPEMEYGNMPLEGTHLRLTKEEKDSLVLSTPNAQKFLRRTVGGEEFLKGHERYCLWIENNELEEALKIEGIKKRIDAVKKFRINGGDVAKTLVEKSHQFRYRREAKESLIIIPCTSSKKRDYLPCGFYNKSYITLNSAQAIYDAEPWIFAVISSKMHMTWVRAVAGRLKTDYRYSSALCYNTFPIPPLTTKQKEELTRYVYEILGEREKHSEKTMAQLYDPDKMPADLLDAHHRMDAAVERIYRSKPFASDEERLEYLFALYEKMVEEEKMKK